MRVTGDTILLDPEIVDNMITLEKIMLKNCLGNKETYWKSPIEEKFNAVFKSLT